MGRGRKPSENPKDLMLHIRIDAETNYKLEKMSKEAGLPKSVIVRCGIDSLYFGVLNVPVRSDKHVKASI